MVGRHHPIRAFVEGAGISRAVLDSFITSTCPPDVIGINDYVTSDRSLDEDIAAYPIETRGGNGRETYWDIEAARVTVPGIVGHRLVLQQVWDREQR